MSEEEVLESPAQQAFFNAIALGNMVMIQEALSQGANLHARQNHAIFLSAYHGHANILQFLHEHGLDIHANQQEALFIASYNSHCSVLNYLLKNGGDVHTCFDKMLKIGPLEIAAINGHLEVVQLLVGNGAFPQKGMDYLRIKCKGHGLVPAQRLCFNWMEECDNAQREKQILLKSTENIEIIALSKNRL